MPRFVEGAVLVTVSDNVRVRSKPRVSSDSTRYEPVLPRGTEVVVTTGPVAASGYWWYKVELVDVTLKGGITTGWLAAVRQRRRQTAGCL